MSEVKATTRQHSLASSDSANSEYSDGHVSSWTQKQCVEWFRNIELSCSGTKDELQKKIIILEKLKKEPKEITHLLQYFTPT